LKDNFKVVATNKKATHDYTIEDTFESGIVLSGTEMKSIRGGRVNLRDGFAQIKEGEVWLMNVHISPYEQGNIMNHEPRRPRKLLLHRREINRLIGKVQERGFTLIPLRLIMRGKYAKLELGLARGKKTYDKREALREKETKVQLERVIKERRFQE
jgi:SsrA-binding protein